MALNIAEGPQFLGVAAANLWQVRKGMKVTALSPRILTAASSPADPTSSAAKEQCWTANRRRGCDKVNYMVVAKVTDRHAHGRSRMGDSTQLHSLSGQNRSRLRRWRKHHCDQVSAPIERWTLHAVAGAPDRPSSALRRRRSASWCGVVGVALAWVLGTTSACKVEQPTSASTEAGRQPATASGANVATSSLGTTTAATLTSPPADDNALARRYEAAKAKIDEALQAPADAPIHRTLEQELREVIDQAKDPHLRANATLALGLLFERRGDLRSATGFYRQAQAWVPQEPEVHAVLALALAQQGEVAAAIDVQEKLVRLVPDDLQAWLVLGELNVKAKREEDAKMAYAAYETRRKGLLDGLTLKAQGQYVKSESDRVACAHALAPARDNGTALALLYALHSDPSPRVREQIALVMAEQRLKGYAAGIAKELAREKEQAVLEALKLAKSEIEREPRDAAPGLAPALADTTTTGSSTNEGSATSADSTTAQRTTSSGARSTAH